MKKYIILLSIVLTLMSLETFASVTTYTRTREDLQVSEEYSLTEKTISAILATPKVDETEKIYDFAGLLSVEEEVLLYDDISTYINDYSMDMIVVTIDSNNKSSAKEYADDFYDYNYFGIGNTHDGIIFLIDMDNRDIWLSTTGKAILIYDDNRVDNILDGAYYYVSNQDYYNTVKTFIGKATNYAKQGNASSNKDYRIDDKGEYVYSPAFPIGVIVVFSAIGTTIFLLIASAKHRVVKQATHANEYFANQSLRIDVKEDKFMNTHTSKVYSPRSSDSGGGRSGGSSVHHSSSGRSHGGGGRHF